MSKIAFKIESVQDKTFTLGIYEVQENLISLTTKTNDGTISNSDINLPTYQGATNAANGVSGLVPAAIITENDKFLKGDGTWAEVSTAKEVGYFTTEPTQQSASSLDLESFIFYEDSSAETDLEIAYVSLTGNQEVYGVKSFVNGIEAASADISGTVTADRFNGNVEDGTLATANAVVVTNASKKLTASTTITTTELGYLDGVTSSIQTQLDGKAASSHNHDASDITSGTLDAARLPSIDASKITSGTIDIARLPAGALERLVTVADETARFALTSSNVQLGDTVRQSDTGLMYYVVDTSKLNSAAGYVEYTAGTATSVLWSGITGKPTTIAGYGITDAKIASGTITLGSATITPLTASSTIDASKLSGTASVSTTGNAATVTGTAGISTLDWNSEVTLYTVGGHEVKAKLPANPNTDTKVRQYVGNTSQERPILSRYTITDASTTANYVVYDTGVTNNPATHTLTASGGFIGNATTSTQTKGVFLVIPTQTSQTATLTANVEGITEYFPGLTIAYRAPFNTAASSTLNINNLGAKPIYYKVNTASKDYYPANTLVLLVYETTTASSGCWKMVYSYDGNNNNYDRRLHNNAVKAAAAVTAGTVIVGTSAGYKTAASGVIFDISYPILYASEAIAANATNAKTYEAIPSVNLQTTKASWTGTQYATAYLVGTLSGTTFIIDSSIFTTTVPSSADGKVYIPLGVLYSTYQVYFAPTKDIYQYTNGSFHPLDTTTVATGGSNGTIKINGTDVAVKGINTAAYKADTYFAQASHGTHVSYSSDAPAAVGTASAGSASTVARSDHVHSLPDSGVTANTYGNTAQQTPSHGGTFNIPYVTVDAKGIVTGAGTTTVKLPADNNTDTKVNVTLGTTTKAYLLGTSTTPTSTATAVTSIADTGVYLDTTAGRLTAGSFAGDGQNITYGSANAVVVTDANKKLVSHSSVTTTELGYLDGVTSSIQTQLDGKAASSHNQASSTINAMTGYSKPSSTGAIATTDTLNAAIGKLEKALDGKQASGSYAAASHNHDASNINSGTLDAARIPNLDASKITSGTIDIARLPAGALERLVTVADQTARFALTSSNVQLGDTVRQSDTGLMYYVVDTSKLNSADGYAEYTAGAATSVPWSGITSKPSTFTPSAHNQASNTINAMTGYSKPSSTSAIATTDSLNSALGKLEKALDGKQASGSYAATSHNQASSTINVMTGYSKPSSTSAISTSDTLNGAIGKLEKALDGKQASGTYLTPSSILDATKLSGTIPSGCYTNTVYTHPTTSGNKHIPSGGSSGQFLGWDSDGTAKWVANPNSNWTTHLYAGAASNATANATSATTNGATYIVVCDNSTARNAVQVTGTNGTTVSAVNGKLTIDSVSLSAVTNAEIDAVIFA